jgi:hypothetical protein
MGPFTLDPSLNFDDARLYDDGKGRITSIAVFSSPETGVDGISIAYGSSSSPVRGRGRAEEATVASLTLDAESNEYISQAYVVASSSRLEALVFVTDKGRAVGGSSTSHLRHFAAAVPAFPCVAGLPYRLAFIKGRSSSSSLEQVVLVWAPAIGGAARSSQRQLLGAPVQKPESEAERKLGSTPGRLLQRQRQVPTGAAARELLHSAAPYRQQHSTNRTIISQRKGTGAAADADAAFWPLRRYILPAARIRTLSTTKAGTACATRPAGYTQTGPFNSDGSSQPITSYFNHWLHLGQLVPPSQQPLAKPPAITSISIYADTPGERVTGMSVTFAGGYTLAHGRTAAAQPQARLDLAEDESIVHASVSQSP